MINDKLKPGHRTSEFWMSLLAVITPQILDALNLQTKAMSPWATAAVAAAYALSRGLVKATKN